MTLKPCKKCGADDRKPDGRCRPCGKATSARWAKANREKKKAYDTAWAKANPDRIKASQEAWAKANPVKLLWKNSIRSARKHSYTPMTYADCEKAIANRPTLCESCDERPATHCDHDHATGVFRGWLCQGCNIAEGFLGTVDRQLKLLAYTRKHQSVTEVA